MVGLVSTGVVHAGELRAVDEFLAAARLRPRALILEGDAGIGKTTVWLAGLQHAEADGVRVLSARVGQAETVLAYAAVADLLSDVDADVLDALPPVQRVAVDHVLLRATSEAPATDHHVVAAAFVSIVGRLAADGPVLIALDDVQWLDRSSRAVLAFATRRFKGAVGVLCTERCEPDCGDALNWLHLAQPDSIERIRLTPLSLGGLHSMLLSRLGRSFPRPTMVRIAEISGGNPFYALELARAIDVDAADRHQALPATLAELMRLRIGRLDPGCQELLLIASCVADPTVDLLAHVDNLTVDRVADLLAEAEGRGLIAIDGNRIRFAHPLLARCVYDDASPARRRAVHRLLADALVPPELKARHLALAASSANMETLEALDAAAAAAVERGAPAAAAEFVDLAIGLGGDTPVRRIRSAELHFKAGDARRAEALLPQTVDHLPAGALRASALHLLAAIRIHDDNWVEGIALLQRALDDCADVPAMHAHTLASLAFAERVIGKFDQSLVDAQAAVTEAEQVGAPAQISQALATSVYLNFFSGKPIDDADLRRAVELEDLDADGTVPFSASVVEALVLTWSGQLDRAATKMSVIRSRCIERGAENDLMSVTSFATMVEVWRGNLTDAAMLVDDAMERAQQGGGSMTVALTMRALVAAYAGRAEDTRADVAAALVLAERGQSPRLAEWPTTTLGFLELSLGNAAGALDTLRPLLMEYESAPGGPISTAYFLPDAIEAMIVLNRLDEAQTFIEALERHGRRLDRVWMLAAGARCRSMLLAARGDVDGAARLAEQAMAQHDRIPMRFERARTQLLLGQLQRRQRRKETATNTLREALATFEDIGTPLWAEKARAELARTKVAPSRSAGLTPTELRVAQLVASGKTNRDVAAGLFISPKTVEANLARVYRKLGINSRAELGRVIDDL